MSLKKKISILAVLVIAAMIIALIPLTANAASETGREDDQKLMNGVWESTVYVTDSNNNNVRAHILKINNNSNVALKVTTADYYRKNSTKTTRAKKGTSWGYATLEKMIGKYSQIKNPVGTVIAGINGDFYQAGDFNGQTIGKLIMEGNVINPSTSEPFFAVMKDGSYRIMEGTSDTTNVEEAVAGRYWILKNGKNVGDKKSAGDTVVSIGITKKNDIIITCIDGREPSSAGTSMYNLGSVMKQQGCTNAILLDCGGSASFLTKRSGDKNVVYRNVPNDGVERPISSGLMVVKKSKVESKPDNDKAASTMKSSKTKLYKKNGVYYYKANGKKISGFRIINDKQYLFNKSGKGMTKTITIGKTKYYYTKGKLTKTSDKNAGRIAIGFCGASKNKQNLIYAYHYGNKRLNIGLNPLIKANSGKMEDWENVVYVPWSAVEREVKNVVIGDGVKNVGSFFLYVSRDPFNKEAKKIKTQLRTISFPESLTTIGLKAFYNHDRLTSVTIPKKVSKIQNGAFAYNSKIKVTFKRNLPPTFGKNVFQATGKSAVIKAPSKTKWKNYLKKSKNKKKLGFTGKVEYVK